MKRRRRQHVERDEWTGLLLDKADDLLSRLLDRMLPVTRPVHAEVNAQRRTAPSSASPPGAPPPGDPYRVLGLPRTATADDVRRRVRELAKVFHPDKPLGSVEKMAEITEAANALLAKLR